MIKSQISTTRSIHNYLNTIFCEKNKTSSESSSEDKFNESTEQSSSPKFTAKAYKSSFDIYKLILHNDNITPIAFVIDVIQKVFGKSPAESYGIMYEAHIHGKVIIGFFPKDIAHAYTESVRTLALQHGYPLRCTLVQI